MAKCGELTILFMVVAQEGETIRRDGQLHYFWINISYAPISRMQYEVCETRTSHNGPLATRGCYLSPIKADTEHVSRKLAGMSTLVPEMMRQAAVWMTKRDKDQAVSYRPKTAPVHPRARALCT